MHRITTLPVPGQFRDHMPVQLRFNDVDVLGHVNNTVYLSFYDTGKAHYFNAVRPGRISWAHVDTVIANVECAYLSPILFGDRIEVYTRALAIGEKSFVLEQMLYETVTGTVKSVCRTVMVSFDPTTHKTVPLSAEWREGLTAFEGRVLPAPDSLAD